MKRIILLAAFLVAASACTSETNTNTSTNTNTPPANMNANTSASPKAETTVSDSDITAQEKQIWDKIKTKDPDGFASMLADDFIYIAPEGVYDKAGTVNGIKQIEMTDITFSDWKVVMLDKDAAAVTYTVQMKGTSGGKPMPEKPLRASSAWVKRGDKWVGVYHQECEIKPPPPTPPSSNASTAKATPTPESKPAANSDPLSNEKAVWDALKRKDYDAFASFLSDNAIEVEETGVYDKAGSVKGVSMFDASKAALSDFKTVNLDSNATLVTYLVKIPIKGVSPLGERHSTIWVNRDGKWLAMFHHGTSAVPPPPPPPPAKK